MTMKTYTVDFLTTKKDVADAAQRQFGGTVTDVSEMTECFRLTVDDMTLAQARQCALKYDMPPMRMSDLHENPAQEG